MKLAFISDIHANLPALEAVLDDIRRHAPDNIYCLGDLVNFACWDNEVIDLIRSRNISCVQGNHDEGIGNAQHLFGYSFNTEAQKQFGIESIKYVNRIISDANRNFLKALPFSSILEFHFPFQTIRVGMVHGSTISNKDYLFEDAPDDRLTELLEEMNVDILFCGHTHLPFHRIIFCEEENRKLYRHVINAGSVGKPKQENNQPCYVLLEINEHTKLSEPDSVISHFHYVNYDAEKAMNHIHANGLGNAYDDYLQKAIN
jgi:putative phosphoesterase